MLVIDSLSKRAKFAARKYGPEIGSDLIKMYPERIPELFRELKTLQEIIFILGIQDLYPHASLKTLSNAINYALGGFDGLAPAATNIHYMGLMDQEEVAIIHGKIKKACGERMGGIRWKETEQSWSEEETQFLKRLKTNLEFKLSANRKVNGFDYEKIAKKLNDQFHNGQPIRTAQTVKVKIYRI